jgi:dihydroflavonol-4-reductase
VKVFITGSTGFIGKRVVKRLSETDHEVYCLVRKTSHTHELEKFGVNRVYGDITDKRSVLAGMKGCDWVIHGAAIYSFWEPNKRAFIDVNVTGTRNVMEACLESGVTKVVHVSSTIIFGKPTDFPFNEESAPGPVRFSVYAQTKYEADNIAWELHRAQGLPLVVIYPALVVGPGDVKATGKYILRLIQRKMPATVFEDAVMTLVHVQDVAAAIVRALEKENNIGEKYIVGKYQHTVGELNRLISEISGAPLPRFRMPGALALLSAHFLTAIANLTKRPPMWDMSVGEIRTMQNSLRADGGKAERELGIAYTPIRMALEEAVASFRAQARLKPTGGKSTSF